MKAIANPLSVREVSGLEEHKLGWHGDVPSRAAVKIKRFCWLRSLGSAIFKSAAILNKKKVPAANRRDHVGNALGE